MERSYSRKDFLKIGGKVSCAVLLAGTSTSVLESCSSVKVLPAKSENGKVKIPLSAFAETSMRIVRVEGLQYDVLVAKKPDDTYSAVLMRCSHQDWNLTANAKGLFCGLHGSTFDLNGAVKNGPATEALKVFKIEQLDNYLLIY
jgi:nitrite reductase/ring-hydroxylating ferredoxin subunit